MQPEYVSVGDLFLREGVFVVPLFQRPYVWDEERWQSLWDDIRNITEDLLAEGSRPRRHFLGSIVVQQRPSGVTQIPRREVIDGQQRLTTLQVFLKATSDALEEDLVTAERALPFRNLLRHPHAAKTDIEGSYKVWPTNIDRSKFRSVMDGLVPDKPSDDDRFAQGYRFFKVQIAKWLAGEDAEPESRYNRGSTLSQVVRQHLWLIALNLAEDDQPQVIFETLNARGTALLPGDLVKNLLLRRAQEEGAPIALLYEKHWRHFDDEGLWQQKVGAGYTARPRLDFFLQQALTVLTQKSIAMGQVYDQFASYISATRGRISASEHLEKLSALAIIAKRFYLAEDNDPQRAIVAAARIRAMDFSTVMPVFITLMSDPGRDPGDSDTCARWLESFLVRRTVCGLNTGMYGLLFVEVMKVISRHKIGAAEAVAEYLLSKTSDSECWPDDEQFGEKWLFSPLYKTLKRGRLTMVLRALEESFRDSKLSDPAPLTRALHVEHIMPQSWSHWWPLEQSAGPDAEKTRDRIVHTIGNLTLIRERLNEKLSNSPWTTVDGQNSKRAAFRQHGLMSLNIDLAKNDYWNEETIAERGKLMLQHAIRIWDRPTIKKTLIKV